MADGSEMSKEGQQVSQFNIRTPLEHVARFQQGPVFQSELPDIRMQADFNPTPGEGNKPADQTDSQRGEDENRRIAEMLMGRDYRGGMTIIGSDLIKEIQSNVDSGNYERLERSIMKALPLTEGLEFGIYAESYGVPETSVDTTGMSESEVKASQVRENNVYSKLRNQFMTVEDSIDRGNIGYLRDAMLDSLSRPIRELEEWDKDGGATWGDELREKITNDLNQQNFAYMINGDNDKVLSEDEMKRRIDNAVTLQRRIQEKKVEKIREKREDLLALDLHVKSRFAFDLAFRHRQYVAHDRDLQSNMKQSVGLGTAEPDGTHFQGFYQVDTNWGEAVDKVERELVRLGKDGFFSKGNLSTKDFKIWMDRLLNESQVEGNYKKRMDVVWAAWKMFSFKEMPGKFALDTGDLVNKKNKDSGHKINFAANPPYVGDLSTWLSNPEEHRASEFGWNIETLNENKKPNWNGQVKGERTKAYKAVSHSGHPLGIGYLTTTDVPTDIDPNPIAKFGKNKVGNFMEFVTMKDGVEPQFEGRNLWEVWQGYEVEGKNGQKSIVEGMSQADPEFPWADTDFSSQRGEASNEIPTGPVGYWFLQRGRAYSILKENLGVPELRGMTSIAYVSKLRNWDKLGMIKPGMFTENPAFVKIYSDLMFYKGMSPTNMENYRTGKNVSELEFSATDTNEWVIRAEGGQDWKGQNLTAYLLNARQAGLVDYAEYVRLSQIRPRG